MLFYVFVAAVMVGLIKQIYFTFYPSAIEIDKKSDPVSLYVPMQLWLPSVVAMVCMGLIAAMLLPTHGADRADSGRYRGPLWVLLVVFIALAIYVVYKLAVKPPPLRAYLGITAEGVCYNYGSASFSVAWEDIIEIKRHDQPDPVVAVPVQTYTPLIIIRVRHRGWAKNHELRATQMKPDPVEVVHLLQHLHKNPDARKRIASVSSVAELGH